MVTVLSGCFAVVYRPVVASTDRDKKRASGVFESGADNIRRYEDETKMEMVCDDECGNAAVWRMFTKEHAG